MDHTEKRNITKKLLITNPFWKGKLDVLTHPAALRMYDDLDLSGPLGIGSGEDPFWKGFKHTYGKKEGNIDFLLRIKAEHPEKIIIVQVGEFYETWGIDSVFLVEHCGLNRMGKGGPRAGTPLANIQTVLDRLTQVGFSVVICEQADDLTSSGRKTRFISEIVTPSSPVYTYGLAMDRRRSDAAFPDTPPEFGIVQDKRGLTIVEINLDLRTTFLLEGLTEEAARMRLSRYSGRFSRIFIHENVTKKFLESCHIYPEDSIRVSGYLAKDFATRMEELLKIDLSLDARHEFLRITQQAPETEIAPRPLYQGTAEQMGLLPMRGIPDLIHSLLPPEAPQACQNLLRNYLLHPPPQSVAESMRKTIQTILTQNISFPDFPVANPARYIKTLHKREAGPEILKDLSHIAQSFLKCYQSRFLSNLPDALAVVSHLSHMPVHEEVLQEKSHIIAHTLAPVIPTDRDPAYTPQNEQLSHHFFEAVEDEFRGRVARTSTSDISRLYIQIGKAAADYEKAINEDLMPLINGESPLDKGGLGDLENTSKKNKSNGALSFDIHNKAIWFRGNLSAVETNNHSSPFIHPIDRYGKEVRDRWSTEKVELALQHYKQKAEEIRQAVSDLLKLLAEQLSVHSVSIVHLALFSNLMRTLLLHAEECKTKQWGLRVLSPPDKHLLQNPNGHKGDQGGFSKNRLEIYNLFPYWMTPQEGIKNTLRLKGMSLLTGHNMAGKSTTLRSSAVVTLLASCGMMFPAEEVILPEPIDGWFVRTGSHDDPESGLSAFAVEITDVNTALRDATEHSFILIDELGKGTESKAGHAIAGSILEHLHERNIRGIFATHWHELFFSPALDLQNIETFQMEIKENNPTYKMVPGYCLSSWAFEAAQKLGMDNHLLRRAKEIAEKALFQIPEEEIPQTPKHTSLSSSQNTQYTLKLARELLSQITEISEDEVRMHSLTEKPFVKDGDKSVVYILETDQGYFYVGETDHIENRLTSHAEDLSKRNGNVVYAVIPEGKSLARRYENKMIAVLRALGFPMLSTGDAVRKHFGG